MHKVQIETKGGETLEIEYKEELIEAIKKTKGIKNPSEQEVTDVLKEQLRSVLDRDTNQRTDQVGFK